MDRLRRRVESALEIGPVVPGPLASLMCFEDRTVGKVYPERHDDDRTAGRA